MADDPPSADALTAAIARLDRRMGAAPSADDGRYVVSAQRPDPGQGWLRVDSYADMAEAMDGALAPLTTPQLPPTSLVRITLQRKLVWLGVMTDSRSTVAAPALTRGEAWRDWVHAWSSPSSEARWMLSRCHGVDRVRLVLAACACARVDLEFVPAQETRPLFALQTAEAWCRGDADVEDVSAAAKYGWGAVGALLSTDRVASAAAQQAVQAAEVVFTMDRTSMAARAAVDAYDSVSFLGTTPVRGLVRAQAKAARVREEIPLGVMLLARIAAQARTSARPVGAGV